MGQDGGGVPLIMGRDGGGVPLIMGQDGGGVPLIMGRDGEELPVIIVRQSHIHIYHYFLTNSAYLIFLSILVDWIVYP